MTKFALALAAVASFALIAPAHAEEHAAAADASVTCVVKEVELTAKSAEDCTKAGGTVKAAEAAAPAAEEHKEEGHAEPAKH